jgi:4-amino-4-deoxy-L-arabinose transferase-like glycosyltransferase
VETAGLLISHLCGGLLVVVIFLMAKEFYGSRTAWAAAAFAAAYPVLVEWSADVTTEGLYTLVLTLATWAGCRLLRSPSLKTGFVLGALFGWAYLVRGEAILFMILLPACGIVAFLSRGAQEGRTSILRTWSPGWLAMGIGFALLALPYMLFLRSQDGSWAVSGKTMENLLSFDITEQGVPVDTEQARMALSADGLHLQMELARKESAARFLWLNRSRQLRKYVQNLLNEYVDVLPRAIYPAFLILIGAGMLGGPRTREEWVRELYLAGVLALPFAFYPMFLVEVRYIAPVVPVALCWAGRGAVRVSDAVVAWTGAANERKTLVLGLVVAAVIALHAWPIERMIREDPWSFPLEHKAAGEWLRIHGKPHAKIMNRKSFVAYYAGGEPHVTPYTDYPHLLVYARSQAIDYLIVDERYTLSARPGLQVLADANHPPPELELIHSGEDVPGRRIFVYAIRPGG